MFDVMTKALETQMMPIALLMPHGQEIRIVQNLQGTVTTSSYEETKKLEGKCCIPANLAGHITIRDLNG